MEKNKLKHLAIIPDGNTRWAKSNKLPVFEGYRKGMSRVVEISRHSRKLGIHTLTMWGLSTENWQYRPKAELEFLTKLFMKTIDDYIKDAEQEDVKIIHLGRKDRLPKKLLDKIKKAEDKTRSNQTHILNIALDYGGHDEILRTITKIINDIQSGKLKSENLSNNIDGGEKIKRTIFSNYLDTGDQPYPFPDFIIRTSGEMRLSGFFPWQSVYSELHFEKCFFPDFNSQKLESAIKTFNKRKRRFGGGHKV